MVWDIMRDHLRSTPGALTTPDMWSLDGPEKKAGNYASLFAIVRAIYRKKNNGPGSISGALHINPRLCPFLVAD